MASKVWSEDRFSCPVCLELLKDPVAIPCGHSYCMGCIKNCWDHTDHTGVYSCPQCRETFTPRPVLRRNTMLAELVEELKTTGLNPPPAQSYAGPGDVSCDVCTGRKFKAVQSCLTCLASYCETHVKPHYEGAAFKRHKLINAIENLEEKLCAEHQRVLEVFCRTDQMCICWLCTGKEHKSHDTVSAETERTGKQKQLGETQTEIQQRIQERLKEIEELKQAVESLKSSACIEIKESEKIFTELIISIEKIHTEVIELIGANEKSAVNQAEGRMKKLEQEIAELRRRNAELKQLSETEDHIHFLQNFQSLCAPPEAGDLPSVTVNTDISFEAVRKAVSELKDHIVDFCKGELVKITKTVNEVAVYSLQAPEPRNRAEFLKFPQAPVPVNRSSAYGLPIPPYHYPSPQAPVPVNRSSVPQAPVPVNRSSAYGLPIPPYHYPSYGLPILPYHYPSPQAPVPVNRSSAPQAPVPVNRSSVYDIKTDYDDEVDRESPSTLVRERRCLQNYRAGLRISSRPTLLNKGNEQHYQAGTDLDYQDFWDE